MTYALNALTVNISKEIIAVRKRMLRLSENGDLKRLIKLRDRLHLLQQDLEIVKEMRKDMGATRFAPKFRKSYSFESWYELGIIRVLCLCDMG